MKKTIIKNVIAGLTRNPLRTLPTRGLAPLLLLFFCFQNSKAADYEVKSPNNQLQIKLHINNGTQYEIWADQTQLIASSPIGLRLENGTIVGNGTVKETETRQTDKLLQVPIGKNKAIEEKYNELIIRFNEDYDLEVRAYNEGLAYRFVTAFENEIIFLSPGKAYQATLIKDGNNASNYPTRYVCENSIITQDTKLNFSMAKGGGFVVRLVELAGNSLKKVNNSSLFLYGDKEAQVLNLQSDAPVRSIAIFNAQGQLVFQQNTGNARSQQVDIAAFSPGAYIAKVKTEAGIVHSKFVH
jgi:hypothetical protein